MVATYTDADDSDDVSRADLVIDPSALVFDSQTGAPLDGARVTLVDADSGQPAEVFGADGVASYPSTVVTGEAVTDGAGNVVDPGEGRFRFPVIPPGEYRYEVEPPEDHRVSLRVADADLQELDGRAVPARCGQPRRALHRDGRRPERAGRAAGSGLGRAVPDQVGAQGHGRGGRLPALRGHRPERRRARRCRARGPCMDSMPHGLPLPGAARRGSASEPGAETWPSATRRPKPAHLDCRTLSRGERPAACATSAEVAAGRRRTACREPRHGGRATVRSSNTAEARVVVREDLLRSRATLIGRVSRGRLRDSEPEERKGLTACARPWRTVPSW
ncbi:MAG: carboxypeptidase-like regulatory domain-containing protein [Gammaproteobacteria bacterium]|nr:carboxypeptidase-like regulatory domain-containing protein [Gammaproteobacteria bacterium]